MTEEEKKFLTDICFSIELIEDFTKDIVSFDNYINDYKTKSAVERHLAIVGEALNKFLKISAHTQIENTSEIISLRNRIIHSYDNIDDAIIWAVLTRHLLPLKKQIVLLLE
ncbi:DUF86 domain-containing protein [Pedobacter alpinus]|uniref:DUF86 domain-containing protein n=1 Tax=Pedobacter alpinus TaxID=1590643 RepID=A0ABW5TQ06_9SPHI